MRNTNSVITYLANYKWSDVMELIRSVRLLDKNFNNKYRYPIVIFHEEFDNSLIEIIKNLSSSDIEFRKIKLRIPDWINKNEIPEYFNDKWGIGYRHMCRFFSKIMYEELKNYDYLWRLDTDSYIIREVKLDPFELMKNEDIIHGYVGKFKEKKEVIENFIPTISKYFGRDINWDRTAYQMNFEISNISFFTTEPYKGYMDYIDRLGGIYKYRWGDIPIKTIALNEFGAKVKKLNIGYQHQYFKTIF